MPQNIVISDFKPNDLEYVLAIEKSVFSSPWTFEMFQDAVNNNVTRFKTAKLLENGFVSKICGYVVYWILEGETSILNIAVAQQFQRMGIARQMLDYLEADSTANDSFDVFLEVRPSNSQALGLYLNNGFKQIDVRKKYYVTEDALILHKKLGNFTP